MSFLEALPTYAVGTLVAAGGFMGFKKAHSLPSLIAGLGFGTLFGVSGYLIQDEHTQATGRFTGLACSGLLLGTMGKKFVKTKALFPSGAMTGLSLISTSWHGYTLYNGWYDKELTVKERHIHEMRRDLERLKAEKEKEKHKETESHK